MMVFKCKMCGGELEVKEGMSICECPYCGTKQTLPKLDDDKKIALYDRANHFRRNNEYDKAMGIYETILAEDKEDAEAYWSLVLCKYGIEYVEDPVTHKRVPTVNRAQYTSVFIDEDYESAVKYADGYQREIYEQEAKAIDEIQKGILAISSKEEPFDVFICYKETDSSGRRTEDSVYAQDIYKALSDEGFKVFFARITLEDKLGTEYEPYIFAALNSAKVMVVVGTNSKNYNAVWVKNEWSRYLALIKNGENKSIIPVYKNMDPYDLPEEFSYLQAQDMNKVGFMQDLIYGVKKLISQEVIDERQKKGTSSVIVDTMTRRASTALANSEWDTAKRCYDTILDYDENNVDAHLGKLKAEYKVSEFSKLSECDTPLDINKEYQILMKIADDELIESLKNSNDSIKNKIKSKKNKKLRIRIVLVFSMVVVIVITFLSIYCFYPLSVYYRAMNLCNEKNYADSYKLIESMDDVVMLNFVRNKTENAKFEILYQEALNYMDNGQYDVAQSMFESNSDYKDSQNMILECKYLKGIKCLENSDFDNAVSIFEALSSENYKDSVDKLEEAKTEQNKYNQSILEEKYQYVLQHKTNSDSKTVEYMKDLIISDYKDSKLIKDQLDVLKIELYTNSEGYDSTKNSSVFYDEPVIYINVKIISGPSDTSIPITCRISYEGLTKTQYYDDMIEYGYVGDIISFHPMFSNDDYTVQIFDKNNNLLVTKIITLHNTDWDAFWRE